MDVGIIREDNGRKMQKVERKGIEKKKGFRSADRGQGYGEVRE
jgi:hypothetical protein